MMRNLIRTTIALAALLSGLSHPAAQTAPGTAADGLTLLIESAAMELDSTDVEINYRLLNTRTTPITVCTWPGIEFWTGYKLPDGTENGIVTEAQGSVVLGGFRTLPPGESITGRAKIPLFPTPTGKLLVIGIYRSGGEHSGGRCLSGKVKSRWLELTVGKAPPSKER